MLNNLSSRLLAIATIETVLNTQQQYSHTHKTTSEPNRPLTGTESTAKPPGAGEIAVGFSV